MAPGEFRLRICYQKAGRLRFLSHLEVMRALERGARRADLPYAVTKGFNPHMKVAFGPALPVGTAGEHEYLDVWLTEYVPAEVVLRRLVGAMPTDLAPLEARYVAGALPSLSAACTVAVYVVRVRVEGVGSRGLAHALDEVVQGGELRVEHKGKTKVFDLARSLPKEPVVREVEGSFVIELVTRMGQEGSLRPESLVSAALSLDGVGSAVLTVTRTDALVEDDEGGFVRPI